ncbi:MAG TPA: glycosyltransferase family 9 protein [Vicinamibacterales bacterium]|nr:glycosyltransferase family 9 protein [Vicinamibacterales bacterium]
MRILVVRAGALGDTLMATPVLRALATRYPGSAIDVLASGVAAPLLANHPHLGRVVALKWRNLPFAISLEKRALLRRLREASYDLAVVLEQAPHYLDLVRRARPGRIIGFHETPFDPALSSAANNLRAAGFDDWATRPLAPEIFLTDRDLAEAAGVVTVREPSPVVGLHSGYGPVRRSKRNQDGRLRGWKLENFIDLGRELAARGMSIVLTGSAEDRPAVERIAQGLPAGSFVNAAGALSVRGLAAAIGMMDAFVSVDSGPAHIAAAVGTPLVVLWGPGILEQTRPIGARAPVLIVRHPPPCAPCYGTPLMRTCPRNICMESIAPDEVLRATLTLVDNPQSAIDIQH